MYRKWTSLISASLATVCFALAGASVQAQCYPNNLGTCATCPSPVAALGYCGSGRGACCGYGYQGYPGYQYSYATRTPVRCNPGVEYHSDGHGLFGIRAMHSGCFKLNSCGYGVYGYRYDCGCRTQCGSRCGVASPVVAPACCTPTPNCCSAMSNSSVTMRPQSTNVDTVADTTTELPAYNTVATPLVAVSKVEAEKAGD